MTLDEFKQVLDSSNITEYRVTRMPFNSMLAFGDWTAIFADDKIINDDTSQLTNLIGTTNNIIIYANSIQLGDNDSLWTRDKNGQLTARIFISEKTTCSRSF